jgi:tRNA pseudouridine55 synthase
MERVPEGMLLIDKPKGVTSFAVVQKIRKRYNEKKVGHAGTLDPLASGLLVVGVGAGTKHLRHYIDCTKVYEAEICIGEKSTTGDAEGEILETVPVLHIDETTLRQTLKHMVGTLRLPVSPYSAMKQGGEPFYKKARRGEHLTIPIRDMEVYEATLLDAPTFKGERGYVLVRFTVGSGTYVRSLAEELGKQLGYPARIENLRRTQVGEFLVTDAEQYDI